LTYTVLLSRRAEKFYKKLKKKAKARVGEALLVLEKQPHMGKRLHGELKENYSMRVGKNRIIYTVSELLAPFIKPENLNLFRVDGEKIEIRLIQDSRLHMTVRRHNYKTGEKSQIRPRGAWEEDRETCTKRVMKFLASLEVE
jgi:mRNA-degrading endonuclease RelE of RelBE toxin-antitoxin system